MRRSIPILVVILALVSGPGIAQAALEQGTVELIPAATLMHVSYSDGFGGSASVTTLTGSVGFGYCVSDRAELLAGFLVNHISGDFGDATSAGLSGGFGLNFTSPGSNVVPFLQAQLGFVTNSGGGETSLIIPSVAAGIRCLVGTGASVNFAAAFAHETNALGVADVSSNTIGLQVGVSIFPGAGH